MYKSRKKIAIIAAASALTIGGIGVASYFIVNSFRTGELNDQTSARFAGATSALERPFNTSENLSIMDWIFLNKPQEFRFQRTANGYQINIFDYLEINQREIAQVNYIGNGANYTLEFFTPENTSLGIERLLLGRYTYAESVDGATATQQYGFTSYSGAVTNHTITSSIGSVTLPGEDAGTAATRTGTGTNGVFTTSYSSSVVNSTTFPVASTYRVNVTNDAGTTTSPFVQVMNMTSATNISYNISSTSTSTRPLNVRFQATDNSTANQNFTYNLIYNLGGTSIDRDNYASYLSAWRGNNNSANITLDAQFGMLGFFDFVRFIR